MEQHSYCTHRDHEVIQKDDGHEYAEPLSVRQGERPTGCLFARFLG